MAESDISASLSRLRSVSPRLNEASDKLNRTILLVEQALGELNLGVEAYVDFNGSPWGLEQIHEGISYQKFNDQWCICYTTGVEYGPPEDWKSSRLTNTARAIRLKVVEDQLIPKLLEKLAHNAESRVSEVEKAALVCEQIATKLKAEAGNTPKPAAPATVRKLKPLVPRAPKPEPEDLPPSTERDDLPPPPPLDSW